MAIFIKKLSLLVFVCTLFVASACIHLRREPASVKEVFFNLRPSSKTEFLVEFLDLNKISNHQVSFEVINFSDPSILAKMSEWQHQLDTLSQQDVSLSFSIKNTEYSVSEKELRLVAQLLNAVDSSDEDASLKLRKKLEIVASFNERFKEGLNVNIELMLGPWVLLDRIASPKILKSDSADIMVANSSFWRQRGSTDMWDGPSDYEGIKPKDGELCEYAGPKKGFGVHTGFKVNCHGNSLKVKFGNETYSGPLNSRLYYRLGYNVPAIHYIENLRVKYDRNMFLEINSRKQQFVRLKVFNQRVADISTQSKAYLMDHVRKIHFKDGRSISNDSDFRSKFFKSCDKEVCEFQDDNIQEAYEKEIESVEFAACSVTEGTGEEVGAWSYSQLDHPARSEVRALLILGAWTGNFDLRKDNNKLVYNKNLKELLHYVSDPGSGLGNAGGIFKTGSKISDMHWRVSVDVPELYDGQGEGPSIQLDKFNLIEKNESFRQLTWSEARWMLRNMASVSEQELSVALAASGLSAAEFLLAREKMISIRQKLLQDFGLAKEFPGLFRKINKRLNFNPEKDQVQIEIAPGKKFILPPRNMRLVEGVLEVTD